MFDIPYFYIKEYVGFPWSYFSVGVWYILKFHCGRVPSDLLQFDFKWVSFVYCLIWENYLHSGGSISEEFSVHFLLLCAL